ncbi:MAG: hypothetical protein ACO4AM_06755 [Candidatus Nanopelagicaceae bacterium]|jgi:hypothetical protein
MKREEFERLTMANQELLMRGLDGSPIGDEDNSFDEVIEAEGFMELYFHNAFEVSVVCDLSGNIGVLYDADGPMIQWL